MKVHGLTIAALSMLLAACGVTTAGRASPAPSNRTTPTGTEAAGAFGGSKLNAPPPTTPVAVPAPSSAVDLSDPTAVADAALTALWSFNTATDQSLHAAELRASSYFTPSYRALVERTPPQAPPDATWDTWASHQAVTRVAVSAPEASSALVTSPDTALRQLSVTITPVGADGWTGTPQTWIEFVELVRAAGDRWEIARIETAQ